MIIISKTKKKKYIDIIYRLGHLALENDDFRLFNESVDLMGGIFGIEGLTYAKAMSEKEMYKILADFLCTDMRGDNT